MSASQSELRLARLVDERELVQGKHESKLAEIETREDKGLQPSDNEQLVAYRERRAELDTEIGDLADEIKAHNDSVEEAKKIRRVLAGNTDGVEVDDNGQVIYRTMSSYAVDVLLTSTDRYARSAVEQSVPKEAIQRAAERLQMLERTPATTLTSDIAGLTPPQHIAEIMQIIDNSRPLVEAAGRKATLRQLTVTYPQVDATPVVAVQGTQKTEAGNTGLDVSMVTKTASTYLGGGNISWQAIEFSDPGTLDLWFREAAAHYAYMTEVDAATVVSASAFINNAATVLGATPTYVELLAAVGSGGAEVYANSGRLANALIVAPDRYWYFMGLATASPWGIGGGQGGIQVDASSPRLRVIVSRGLNAGEAIVGDMDGLLVAENAGAPVRLMVSEPAIAGVEVGIVGAFEAAVVDDGAFALITTAS
jgi:hypothetical protein